LSASGVSTVVELLAGAHRAAARDDDLGRGQFRAIELGDLLADERVLPRIGDGRDRLDAAEPPVGGGRIEAGGAHGGDLDGLRALHRGDGVAGVDRALERVGA
jgi:hypothetical protein